MGIQDRDYMKRETSSYRMGDGSVHPALRNLKFAKYGYNWFEKSWAVVILIILIATVMQSRLSCGYINLAFDANKDAAINYKDFGFFINQLFYQPLLLLQKRIELSEVFTFLNIYKNNCLSLESIIFSTIVWLAGSFILIKAFLISVYSIKFVIHKLIFDIFKITPFKTINKQIFRILFPVRVFRFNTIFIVVLFSGLALVQIKLMLTSEPEPTNKTDKTSKAVSVKKNKQTDLVVGSKNYTNIYLNNIQDLKRLDTRVSGITSNDTQNIYTLSKALTEGLTSDLEKTYVIYKWITNNIEYDAEAFFSNNLRGIGNANTVIQRRKAICDGYSELFMRLGLQSGLLVEKVEGFAKGYGFKVGEPMVAPNHAWNSVKVDGNWYLLDATWDAGSLNEGTKRFEKKTKSYEYFLTNPQIFIYSHLPKNDRWQLTNTSVDKTDFYNTVNVNESAFKLGLNIEKHKKAIINVESLPYSLDFDSSEPLRGGLFVNNNSIKGQWSLVKYENSGKVKILISSPSNGSYVLQLYGALDKSVNSFAGIMQYKLNVNNSLNNFGSFPEAYGPYYSSKVILDFPLNGTLSSSQNTRFKLKVNGAKKLAIYLNQKLVENMKEEDGFFTSDLRLEKGELVIFGEFNSTASMDGILKYHVN